jgi:hypothetical protein
MSKDKKRRNPAGVVFDNLKSGFRIFVKPLPPYYIDLIDDQLPLPEYPKRAVTLIAGDVVYWDYNPPLEEPSTDDEDFELYARWREVNELRRDLEKEREIVKRKFLLSNCVSILDGPYKLEGKDWVERVEAAFPNFTIPEHPGKRRLIFLQTQVILSVDEMEIILASAVAPEVTMQGITNALLGFQHNLAERENFRGIEQTSEVGDRVRSETVGA